jgi:hypothetical protein
VRPDVDIPVVDGQVAPQTGGMSVSDDPEELPVHRLPPALGGSSKDRVFEYPDERGLPPTLAARFDNPVDEPITWSSSRSQHVLSQLSLRRCGLPGQIGEYSHD